MFTDGLEPATGGDVSRNFLLFGLFWRAYFRESTDKSYGLSEALLFPIFRRAVYIKVGNKTLKIWWHFYLNVYNFAQFALAKGAPQICSIRWASFGYLETGRGLKMVVPISKNQMLAWPMSKGHEIQEYFSKIIGIDDFFNYLETTKEGKKLSLDVKNRLMQLAHS